LILDAAHSLFVDQGYAVTSIRSIASAAGVADSTVYSAFGDKVQLLRAMLFRAASGTSDDVLPMESEEADVVRAETDPVERLRLLVHRSRLQYERGLARLEEVLREAAAADPRAVELPREAEQQRWEDTKAEVDMLFTKDSPEPAVPREELYDLAWALGSPAVYLMLVRDRRWIPERWEAWLFEFARALVIPEDDGRHGQ
jgi:AcrR family transcriptional regulator